MKWNVLFGLFLMTLSLSVAAQDGTLKLTTEAFQEIEVKGEDGLVTKKTVPAATVIPGTEVMYAIRFQNQGTQPAENVVITNPIPDELIYTTGSAFGSGSRIEVSVDGGKAWGALASLTVPAEDGETRTAEGKDVTHVRWTLNFAVKPGDSGRVTYRAVLK